MGGGGRWQLRGPRSGAAWRSRPPDANAAGEGLLRDLVVFCPRCKGTEGGFGRGCPKHESPGGLGCMNRAARRLYVRAKKTSTFPGRELSPRGTGDGLSEKRGDVWAAQVQTSPPDQGVASPGRDRACFVGFEGSGGGTREGTGCHGSGNRASRGWGGCRGHSLSLRAEDERVW